MMIAVDNNADNLLSVAERLSFESDVKSNCSTGQASIDITTSRQPGDGFPSYSFRSLRDSWRAIYMGEFIYTDFRR